MRHLESKGIQPIVTSENDPDTAVTAYLAGSLAVLTPEDVEYDSEHEGGHTHEGELGDGVVNVTQKWREVRHPRKWLENLQVAV